VLKTIILSLTLFLALPALAQDQQTLNQQAAQRFADADKELNRVYRELKSHLSKPEQEQLVEAQRHWIKFRDANAKAKAVTNEGGSIYPMIYAGTQRRITESRIGELKEWLEEYK
jgi:uncharacterized protein YecT (DUF1311 family)